MEIPSSTWTKEGKKRIEEGGWGEMQYPENYHEVKKMAEKAAKLSDNDISDFKYFNACCGLFEAFNQEDRR